MRTLVISDLHLGNGGVYDAFAAADELPAFLDQEAGERSRVIINGDGVDFLMNEDPLELSPELAAAQARAIAEAPASAGVLRALGRVLARGGEVTIRLGNHDIELALPEVQEVLRGALGQPPAVAARLAFELGDVPAIVDVNGARVLVTHGEHNDKWNKVEYRRLKPESYEYTAGSKLVKQLMNPLAREHRMRFMSFLKPDFQGAALTALAVEPAMVKVLFQEATLDIAWQLFKRMGMATAFPAGDVDLGIADRLAGAGLDGEELKALEAVLGDGPLAYAEEDSVLSRASVKLARAGLELYAGMQRRLTGTVGDQYFRLDPDEAEWEDAQRLAKKYDAGAVIIGHTHAARWKEDDGLVFANTGTWIWLMQLPRYDAGDEAWADFIAELRQNPEMAPKRQKLARMVKRLTAVLIEPHPEGGATTSLVEWDGGRMHTMGQARVPAAKG